MFMRNKVMIVTAGAIPLVELLEFQISHCSNLNTIVAPNKPTIVTSGAAPLSVKIVVSHHMKA